MALVVTPVLPVEKNEGLSFQGEVKPGLEPTEDGLI